MFGPYRFADSPARLEAGEGPDIDPRFADERPAPGPRTRRLGRGPSARAGRALPRSDGVGESSERLRTLARPARWQAGSEPPAAAERLPGGEAGWLRSLSRARLPARFERRGQRPGLVFSQRRLRTSLRRRTVHELRDPDGLPFCARRGRRVDRDRPVRHAQRGAAARAACSSVEKRRATRREPNAKVRASAAARQVRALRRGHADDGRERARG